MVTMNHAEAKPPVLEPESTGALANVVAEYVAWFQIARDHPQHRRQAMRVSNSGISIKIARC